MVGAGYVKVNKIPTFVWCKHFSRRAFWNETSQGDKEFYIVVSLCQQSRDGETPMLESTVFTGFARMDRTEERN